MDKFKIFCEKYPEYCSEELFAKLFSVVQSIGQVRRMSKGSRVVARGIITSVERRSSKNDAEYIVGEICDKSDCIGYVLFMRGNDAELRKGDDVIVDGSLNEWKGTLEIVVRRIEVLGNVYEQVGNVDNDNGNEKEKEPREEPKNDSKSKVDEFKSILESAMQRGAKIKYEKAMALARKLGLSEEEIQGVIEVYEDTEPNTLSKVKYVKLRGG